MNRLFWTILLFCLAGFSESNCPSKDLCVGQETSQTLASSAGDLLQNLTTLYCGCTRVLGNLILDFSAFNSTGLSTSDFAFLSSIKEVSGYLEITDLSVSDHVTLPELQVVQGRNLKNGFGLIVNSISAPMGVLMPKLSEIVRGGASFSNITGLCTHATVNWNDVLTSGQLSTSSCTGSSSSDCSACPSGWCWNPSSSGSKMCQTLTRTNCTGVPGTTRSFTLTNGTSLACDPSCVGGCTGLSHRDCFACAAYSRGGECADRCPSRAVYNTSTHSLVSNPQSTLTAGLFCVNQCPDGLSSKDGVCVSDCGAGLVGQSGICSAPPSPLLTECTISRTNIDPLSRNNYQQYSGCNIVKGHLWITGTIASEVISDPSFSIDDVSLAMSSIQEIRGTVVIVGYNKAPLPFLSNVLRIGSANTADLLVGTFGNIFVGDSTARIALHIEGNQLLQSIDLSRLEAIDGGAVRLGGNQRLCYLGNLERYLTDPSTQTVVEDLNSRGVDFCALNSLGCDAQCVSADFCWGRTSADCVSCVTFRDTQSGSCVTDCSALPGTYGNTSTKTCEPCAEGCTECTGPSMESCTACSNLTIPPGGDRSHKLCVSECPPGLYRAGSSCAPCGEVCGRDGCTGLSGDLGEGGCVRCAQVRQEGAAYQCVTGQPIGHYRTVLPAASGCLLPATTVVYRPCHEECGECVGPSNTHCTSCKNTNHQVNPMTMLCGAPCSEQEYLDTRTAQCLPCDANCNGCQGPSAENCTSCLLVKRDNVCVESCNFPNETAENGICRPSSGTTESQGTVTTTPTPDPLSMELVVALGVAVPLVLCVLVGIILILCLLLCCRVRRSKIKSHPMSSGGSSYSPGNRRSRPHSEIPMGIFFSIPEEEIRSGDKVKEGQFADIYQGSWIQWDESEMGVAIKKFKDCLELTTEDSSIDELRRVVSLNFPHLVKFHGIVVNDHISVVSDYVEFGGLDLYLAENAPSITCEDIMRYICQVAAAMQYLEIQNIPHGSLSARNVLVSSHEHVKVSDIGMLTIVQQGYRDTRNVMAPIRWLAPECIRNNITPSLKSDVWSFGVTVWEILTYGEYPYANLNSPGEVIYQITTMQARLPQTGNCSDELFDVISQCWAISEDSRPKFKRLDALLSQMSDYPKNYIIADQLLNKPAFRERRPAYEEFFPGDLLNLMGSPDSGVVSAGPSELKEKSERLV